MLCKRLGVGLASAVVVGAAFSGSAWAEPNEISQGNDEGSVVEEPPPPPFYLDEGVSVALDGYRVRRDALQASKVEERQRWVEVMLLRNPAIRAAQVAAYEQGKLDEFARSAYINGVPSTAEVVLTSRAGSIGELIHSLDYTKYASGERTLETVEALDAARLAQRRYDAANLAAQRATANTVANRELMLAAGEATRELAASKGPEHVTAILGVSSQNENGCPTLSNSLTVSLGVNADIETICQTAMLAAKNEYNRAAVRWATSRVGSPYACQGVGRENGYQFDCSSFVVRAYADGAGIDARYEGWSPSTHTMLSTSHPIFQVAKKTDLEVGDLVLYDTCPEGEVCSYNHVVMYLGEVEGQELMVHTNACGGVSHIAAFWGLEDSENGRFLGVRKMNNEGVPVPVEQLVG